MISPGNEKIARKKQLDNQKRTKAYNLRHQRNSMPTSVNEKTGRKKARVTKKRAKASTKRGREKRIYQDKSLANKSKVAETRLNAIYGRVIRDQMQENDALKILVEMLVGEHVTLKRERKFLGLDE